MLMESTIWGDSKKRAGAMVGIGGGNAGRGAAAGCAGGSSDGRSARRW